jgi:hypothetical protein
MRFRKGAFSCGVSYLLKEKENIVVWDREAYALSNPDNAISY